MTPRPGETRQDFIRRLVDSAPPLTAEQRLALRPVLAPIREALSARKAA